MAAGKRQGSKQRRAAQNRAQRQALAARTEAAQRSEAAERRAGARAGGASWLSRLLGRPAATREGSRSATAAAGSSGTARSGDLGAAAARGRSAKPVGYRAGLTSLLMALAAVLFTFLTGAAVDADDEPFTTDSLMAAWTSSALQAAVEQPTASPEELAADIDDWAPGSDSQPLAVALWPYSLSLVLPVIGAGIGFRAIAKRSASRVINRALFATLFGALLTSGMALLFVPSVVAMGVAVFQIRRFEMAALAAEQAPGDVPHGEVIDADVVEDDGRPPGNGDVEDR